MMTTMTTKINVRSEICSPDIGLVLIVYHSSPVDIRYEECV